MEPISIACPNCGAPIIPVDGLDTFYCAHCGYGIHMHGMTNAAYRARIKVKRMNHIERMLNKKISYEKFNDKQNKRMWIIWGGIIGVLLILIIFGS